QIRGPAKGWAKLRECTLLEEAHLIEVDIANLRRWNTWKRLRILKLGGRGIKSLQGLENCGTVEQLTLLNLPIKDLSPLRELPRLQSLEMRMADNGVDLSSIGEVTGLRSFTIDSSARENQTLHMPSLAPLARLHALEEVVLLETAIDSGDLMPLAELPKLR